MGRLSPLLALCLIFATLTIASCFGISESPSFIDLDASTDASLTVQTPFGDVLGVNMGSYKAWLGIPYASQERWMAPTTAKSWAPQTLNASAFGPMCPQKNSLPQSEDCLTLNIFTPLNTNESLPVMVWIHGGAFVVGYSGDPLFDGSYFANSTNTILVSLNYRLGALGFLGAEHLDLAGNFGFLDQQFALKWIQENIALFGGNPDQVTIFGQSAGGMSVTYHTVAPGSANLFQRAIIESNPTGVFLRKLENNKATVNNFLLAIDCLKVDKYAIMKCLHSKSISEIVEIQGRAIDPRISLTRTEYFLPWAPLVDGTVIPEQPLDMIVQGKHVQIPIIMGTAQNETTCWTVGYYLDLIPVNDFDLKLLLEFEFKENAIAIMQMYPVPDFALHHTNLQRDILSEITTDFLFRCPTLRAVQAYSNSTSSNAPIYNYNFLHKPLSDASNVGILSCNYFQGACHSSEIEFVFRSLTSLLNSDQYTVGEVALSEQLNEMWAAFAHGKLTSEWTPYTPENTNSLLINIPMSMSTDYIQAKCEMWNSFPYYSQQ